MDEELEGLKVVFEADFSDMNGTPGQMENVLGRVESAAASASENISSSIEEAAGSFNTINAAMEEMSAMTREGAEAAGVSFDDLGIAAEETGTKITESLSSSDIGFTDLEDAISALTDSINSAVDEIDGRIESIGTTAEESASQAESSFSGFDLGGMVNQVGMGIFNLQMMGQVATQTGQALLGPAETAETTKTAFSNLLGSTKAASDELDKLNSFAAKTQFPTQVIDDASASMIAFKIPTETIIPDLTAVGDALSGVGKGTPAELQSVVDILGKMSIAGKLTQGDITELGKHGIDATSAIADGLGISTTALQEMVKKGTLPASDAIAALTKGIEMNPLYNGGMAKQSGTMSGLLSTLSSNWNQVLAAFGSPIIQALDPLLANIGNDLASPGFKDFAGGVGQGIVNVFQDIGHAGEYVENILRTIHIQDFKDAWNSFTVLLEDVEKHLFGAGSAFKELGTDADPVAQIIGNLAQGGLNILSNILWGLDSALLDVDKAFSGVSSPITQAGSSLQSFIGPAQNITSMLEGQFSSAFKFATTSIGEIATWAEKSGVLSDIGQDFMNVGHVVLDLGQIFVEARGVVQDFVEHTFEKFGPILGKIIPPVMQLATTIGTDATQAFNAITPDIMAAEAAFGKFADGVVDRVEPIVEKYLPYIEQGVSELEQAWQQDWPYMQATFETVWTEIEGSVQSAWSVVSGIINVGLDILGGNWGQAWKDMQDSFKGFLSGWETSLKPFLEAMAQIPGPAGDMAKSVLQSFGDMNDGAKKQTDNLKNNTIQSSIDSETETVKHYDSMRQQVLDELKQTTDGAQKQALEQKLAQINNAEETAKNVLQSQKNLHQNIKNDQQKQKEDSSNIFDEMKTNIGNTFSGLGTDTHNKLNEINTDIHNIIDGGTKWVEDRWHDATQFIVDKLDWLYNHNYYFKDFIDSIKGDVHDGEVWLQTTWDGIRANIAHELDQIKDDGSKKSRELWDGISQPFKDAWNYVLKPLDDFQNNLNNKAHEWENDAIGWGEGVISGFVQGMENFAGEVGQEAQNIAGEVAKFLGFHSPAKEGPGAELNQWPKNMIDTYASGLEAAMPTLQTSLNAVMTPVASTLSTAPVSSSGLASFAPSQPLQGNGGGNVTHLHIYLDSKEMVSELLDPFMEQVVKRLRLVGGKMLSV